MPTKDVILPHASFMPPFPSMSRSAEIQEMFPNRRTASYDGGFNFQNSISVQRRGMYFIRLFSFNIIDDADFLFILNEFDGISEPRQ